MQDRYTLMKIPTYALVRLNLFICMFFGSIIPMDVEDRNGEQVSVETDGMDKDVWFDAPELQAAGF